MSGNVSNNSQKIYITLPNGQQVNLNALDKLVGKSSEGSIFAKFDSTQVGGDGDGTYSKAEIEQLKNELYRKYINDSKISQEEIDEVFGKNEESGASNVSASQLGSQILALDKSSDELGTDTSAYPKVDETEHNPIPDTTNNNPIETSSEPKTHTEYVVQGGDSPEKIAQKLGLTGDEAKDFATQLRAQLEASGQMHGKQGNRWLSVGDTIKLPGDWQEKISNMDGYKADRASAVKEYDEIAAKRRAASQPKLTGIEAKLPSSVLKIGKELKQKGFEVKYQENSDGTFSIIQTGKFKDQNVTTVVKKYDTNGKIDRQTQYYKQGSPNESATFVYNTDGKLKSQTLRKSNGDSVISEYNTSGKIIKQTHRYLSGKITVKTLNGNGQWTQRQVQADYPQNIQNKVKEIRNRKGEYSVTKNKDGSFTVTEKSTALSKQGITRRTYHYKGKSIKTTTYYTPKALKEKQAAEEAKRNEFRSKYGVNWGDSANETPFSTFNPKGVTAQTSSASSAGAAKKTIGTTKSKAAQQTNSAQTAKQPVRRRQVPESSATKIPGYESLDQDFMAPQTNEARAKQLMISENYYPEAMRDCIADLRGVGVKVQVNENTDGTYSVHLDDKYCKLIGHTRVKGGTFVTFDKNGNIQKVVEDFGGTRIRTTEYKDGVAQLPKMTAKPKNYNPGIDPTSKKPYSVQNKFSEVKRQAGDNVTLKKDLNGYYTITRTDSGNTGMEGLQSIQYRYDANGKLLYQLNASSKDKSVSIGRLNSDGEMVFTPFKNENGILVNVPDRLYQLRNEMMQDGGEASKIIKGTNTFTITQTKGQNLSVNGLSKIVHKYDAFGKLISQQYFYQNGRVIDYYDAGAKGNDPAHMVNPITIKLPDQYLGKDTGEEGITYGVSMIYGLETKGPKDTAQRFAGTLESKKADLMKTLGLTNEEYDNLAVIAMGIAEQETHFGQPEYEGTEKGKSGTQSGFTDRAYLKYQNNKRLSAKERASHSQGVTQINYNNAIKDDIVKRRFEAAGIHTYLDLERSVENQAVATMIILAQNKKAAEGSTWQTRLRTNNAHITNPNDRLTTNDVIALLWNGAGGAVKRMNNGEVITINSKNRYFKDGVEVDSGPGKILSLAGHLGYDSGYTTQKGASYARNVRAYASSFFANPKTKGSGSMHTTTHANTVGAGGKAQDNGGGIGEVVFMPGQYSNSWRTASGQTKQQQIEMINKNKGLTNASKTMLESYITQGYIGFGNRGLTEEEAMSLTDNDVKLMKTQIDKILHNEISANEANTNFERAYLGSREFTVQSSSVPASSRITSLRSTNPQNNKKYQNGMDFEIHPSFYRGISRHTAQYVSMNDNEYTNRFAVTKSQGVNPTLANGATAPARDRVLAEHAEYTAAELFESGGHCLNGIKVDLEYSMGIDHRKVRKPGGGSIGHAKEMTGFYNAHPEVFDHIKYIDTGNGRSREINGTDIDNLPCGYLGVFIPGEGEEFAKQSGHAFVSDGFGGGFADEHDNGKWAHFGNGKGEHGQLEVYRLSGNGIATVYSDKLGRTVNVPLNINPWYLTPEFAELQTQIRAQKGLPALEPVEEFPI